MKTLYILCAALFLISCKACYKEFYTDSRIQEKKDIVMGILAADSSNGFVRQNAIEIFVGKIVPTDIHNVYFVYGMEDSVLKQLMINTRQFYVAYYEYDPNATVTIEGGGQSVQLSYTDRGIYRDVNRELRIRSFTTYSLDIIKKDGRHFRSQTQVLEPLSITNPWADTVTIVPDPRFRGDTVRVFLTPIKRAIYYMLFDKHNNFSFTVNIHMFENSTETAVIFVKSGLDTTHIDYVTANYEAHAIDSAYGLFNQPHGHTFSTEFGAWDISLYKIPIEERSNIEGKDVVGVFGNYTADRKKVTFKANWGNK